MIMEKIDVNEMRDVFPYFIYQRVNMIGAKNPFFFQVEYGFWYYVRRICARWPEIDAAGAVFAPEINIEFPESARHITHENMPYPLRIITTPGSHGVQIDLGNNLTANIPVKAFEQDIVLLQSDNITFWLSGQNATPFPAWIDILVIGYMIPDSEIDRWKGSNDGR